jgi:hypothetical protein
LRVGGVPSPKPIAGDDDIVERDLLLPCQGGSLLKTTTTMITHDYSDSTDNARGNDDDDDNDVDWLNEFND